MQTVLYGKIKERRGEWLIGANTQNVPYLVATQYKTRQRHVWRLVMRVKARRRAAVFGAQACRCVLIIGKARVNDGQGAQTRGRAIQQTHVGSMTHVEVKKVLQESKSYKKAIDY